MARRHKYLDFTVPGSEGSPPKYFSLVEDGKTHNFAVAYTAIFYEMTGEIPGLLKEFIKQKAVPHISEDGRIFIPLGWMFWNAHLFDQRKYLPLEFVHGDFVDFGDWVAREASRYYGNDAVFDKIIGKRLVKNA